MSAYGRGMWEDDPELTRRRKRRANVGVIAGVALITVALVSDAHAVGSPLLTTAAAVLGFVAVMYGVHVGWLVFYERESDGPPC